jgi:hypothetical protein
LSNQWTAACDCKPKGFDALDLEDTVRVWDLEGDAPEGNGRCVNEHHQHKPITKVISHFGDE